MNLSQRLDAAREIREEGKAPRVRHTIRAARDARIYDGTDVKTGERLTDDRWSKISRDRHGDFHLFDVDIDDEEFNTDRWALDLTTDEPTIDLR